MRKHRSYPVEFKRQVAQEYLAGCPERRQGQAGVDAAADGVTHNAPRRSIENGRQIGKAGRDGDVGDVASSAGLA